MTGSSDVNSKLLFKMIRGRTRQKRETTGRSHAVRALMMAPSSKVGAVRWMTLLLTIIAVWCVGVGMGESTAYLSSFLDEMLAADASYQDICAFYLA